MSFRSFFERLKEFPESLNVAEFPDYLKLNEQTDNVNVAEITTVKIAVNPQKVKRQRFDSTKTVHFPYST